MVCAAIFLARIALKNQKLHLFRRDHLPFLLYAGWAAFIYFHNPIGFAVFGASSGGARFYLKIFLALAAFLIVANQEITNRDCKWILIVTVIGTALDFGKMLLFYYVIGGSVMFENPLENYSWQQELSAVPIVLVLILFARYRTAEILKSHENLEAVSPACLHSNRPVEREATSAAACLSLYPGSSQHFVEKNSAMSFSGSLSR